MKRCFKQKHIISKPSTAVRQLATATACALFALLSTAAPVALAQDQPTLQHNVPRNFPPSSQRGELRVASQVEGAVDGKTYRLAPGLRIFNQQNQLVFAHAVAGQKLDVRYLIEPRTGMLLTAWILTDNELAKEPKRGWFR